MKSEMNAITMLLPNVKHFPIIHCLFLIEMGFSSDRVEFNVWAGEKFPHEAMRCLPNHKNVFFSMYQYVQIQPFFLRGIKCQSGERCLKST